MWNTGYPGKFIIKNTRPVARTAPYKAVGGVGDGKTSGAGGRDGYRETKMGGGIGETSMAAK